MKYFPKSRVPDATSAGKSFGSGLKDAWSTCGSNFNSAPKDLSDCVPDAATKHLLHRDSNVFPHADTIATFQFQLHLKPPISAAVAVIEI